MSGSARAADGGATFTGKTAMVFSRDRDSEGVIRQCLADLGLQSPEFFSGTAVNAIAVLKDRASPRLLIVDIQGLDEPTATMTDLANVCDPNTGVLVIGDSNDIRLYRGLKLAGVVEYYFKPLVRSLVMQSCYGVLTGKADAAPTRSGKLTYMLGMRGAGTTITAAAAAGHLANVSKRRVGFIDLDLQHGDASLQLDIAPSHSLKEALDHPDRVDELFLDRAMIKVGERLGVLAGLQRLDEPYFPTEQSVLSLIEHLRNRYRYIFVDVPIFLAPSLNNALHMPCTVVLFSTATLTGARDIARWREILGPNSSERTTIHVLNKLGAPESLSEVEFTRACGNAPDIVMPYSKEIAIASRLGIKGLQECAPLRAIGIEAPPPVSTVFARVADQMAIGIPFEVALTEASEAIGLADFRFFAVATALQRATGGNLTATLDILSDIMRKRRAVRLKAKAATGEVRMSAYILGAMPFLIIGALVLMSPQYMQPLITDRRGNYILLAAAGSLLLGFGTMSRMMKSVTRV